MGRGFLSRFVSVLLVLAATVGVVAMLSAMSDNGGAGGYAKPPQEEAVQVLSAPAAGEQGISLAAGLGGFVALMAIPLASFLIFAKRMRRNGQRMKRQNQSYAPKKDMSMGKLMKS